MKSVKQKPEKKISVKPYVSPFKFEGNENIFKIYHKVIFNKQSTRISSIVNFGVCSKEELESRINNVDLQREIALLKYYFPMKYKQLEDDLNDSNYNDDTKKALLNNCNAKTLASGFSYEENTIEKVVNRYLISRIISISEEHKTYSRYVEVLTTGKINALQAMAFLCGENDEFRKVYQYHHSNFFCFDFYYWRFLQGNRKYHVLKPTILDARNGTFIGEFTTFMKKEDIGCYEAMGTELLVMIASFEG